MKAPPLSLYVHLPWCVRKCPYCDFNSHTAGADAPRGRYLDALLRDLAEESARADRRPIESVFLGGGTPSLFTPAEIGRLLAGVDEYLNLAPDAEITMEANPGTIECGDPAGYRAAGVNRLSIGAQSFSDEMLGKLGRIHSSADIVRAVRAAREAGFDNLNIDLMHGLPGQQADGAMADLTDAMALEPTHISWYQLTLEPNTVFHARPPAGLPDDDLAFEIEEQGRALLADHDFHQYEVSAYARKGRRCRHNLNYWLFGDYLAVGAGAHGKLTRGGTVGRYQKPANPLQYMLAMENGVPAPEPVPIGASDLTFEFMLNALRLNEGFSLEVFAERTGLDAAVLGTAMEGPLASGLIERTAGDSWRPTAHGRRFLNDLQLGFLEESA